VPSDTSPQNLTLFHHRLSGIAGTLTGVVFRGEIGLASLGACSACWGLAGATVSYSIIHWDDWPKAWKSFVHVFFCMLPDVAISLFPEGSMIVGPVIGHAVGFFVGMGLGFSFNPKTEERANERQKVKIFKFAFIGLAVILCIAMLCVIMFA
jgi:membrane associated rhomboid family serine protease